VKGASHNAPHSVHAELDMSDFIYRTCAEVPETPMPCPRERNARVLARAARKSDSHQKR
jgi:hypothetical protein